ncbi:MAG: sigma-70 family RNA polymerase sigma factor [Candidatus Solibacter usitatus]|nr:sigma-70 family RNA polymerase sigma factor [Candidatus Solibacter usitatus]
MQLGELVEHLFRRQSGRMVAALTAIFGARHLDLAEDVVQEALVKALQVWPFQGIPENPQGWLIQVARRIAIDRLRREASLTAKLPELARMQRSDTAPELDDQLALMFLCCHPRIAAPARVSLTLKVAAGFSVGEIARAFLTTEDAVAQRIVRAKRQIRRENLSMELPAPEELPVRLDSVLESLYLLFNEGYSSSGGDSLLRSDLCEEAVYLTSLLTKLRAPKVHALLALQLFHVARMNARTDASGELLLLEDQNRALWDRRLIDRAFLHLESSAAGNELTAYHLQAAIAAEHASAESLSTTNWGAIRELYEQLAECSVSPVVLLNRAVAISRHTGAQAGWDALQPLLRESTMSNYYLRHAVEAHLLSRLERFGAAREAWRRALDCPCNAVERRFLERRFQEAAVTLQYGT